MEENYEQYFRLQEGEEIIQSIKPLSGLKWMWFVGGILGWLIFMLFAFVWAITLIDFLFGFGGVIIGLGVVLLVLGLAYAFAALRYNMRHYWLTNKRVIGKSGLIGYKVNSIPLERISDVIISRSLWERIFGFGSVHIQTMAGQMAVRGRFGAEGNLQAVPDPEGLQQQIFAMVKRKRKEEKLTM